MHASVPDGWSVGERDLLWTARPGYIHGVPDPNLAKNPSRSAPPLAEVRRMLERCRRATEAARPRGMRRPTDGPPRCAPGSATRAILLHRARALDLVPAGRVRP